MNERIRELALKAKLGGAEFDNGIRYYVGTAESFERFAELIVRECADICNKIYFDRYPDAEDFERSEEGDAIKQHFRVEE